MGVESPSVELEHDPIPLAAHEKSPITFFPPDHRANRSEDPPHSFPLITALTGARPPHILSPPLPLAGEGAGG